MFNLHRHSYIDIGVYYKSTFKLDGYFLKIYMLKSCMRCGKYKEILIDKMHFGGSYSLNNFLCPDIVIFYDVIDKIKH